MIEVRNLTKIFPSANVKAVDEISFTLAAGEVGCIIGTSGCGKTTTLKMLNRLIEPSNGTVKINNQAFDSVDPIEWRRKIGYVVQKAGLLPHLTVKDNISLLSTILKRDKNFIIKRTTELMDTIDMPYTSFAHKYPIELSGGQQQRVGIARALMEDPPVLLMDEPFGALDPITRESLHEEFTVLNKKLKKTIIIVTHDIEEAFKLGDKIILMHEGKILQAGTKDEFINHPESEFVSSFIKGKKLV
ncbi:MAG: ATP-binding cassette domain-containing protein [Halobacteriovoraceae bacterium]|jgi:osmoprotectant transport system ATP-binding protein|nr:ATP-binding cassette domain-containing protein [Halobacteriovoraceae bacterium]